jgi:hypothetical protein
MATSRVIVQLEEVTNSCFVAMPFHSLYDAEYQRVIKPAVEKAGLDCMRGDEIFTRQAIVEDIWHSIRKARLVVAELSGRNPNVMYEIGLARAIGKPILTLTRDKEDVPFDLGGLRFLYYDTNHPDWGSTLADSLSEQIQKLLANPTIAKHLDGVDVETHLPAAPTQSLSPKASSLGLPDLTGAWRTSWLSIRAEREHTATLVIPANHGPDFTASMTVTYERQSQKTIVHETLTGSFHDGILRLTGVNYTYIERGGSALYSLDDFVLKPAEDGKALVGKAELSRGTRDVMFTRLPGQTS